MKRMLITAGPTHEAIDAVRYIGNRSSGRMGIALAEAARDAGWDVTLLLGPVASSPPCGVQVERFTSANDLSNLLSKHFADCDVLVMAAAVADFRPISLGTGKIERGRETLTLQLQPTPDLVAGCSSSKKPGQKIIGFALEVSARLDERAAQKLRIKKLDAIVANPIETLDSPRIAAKVLTPDGRVYAPPSGTSIDKSQFAAWLISWITTELP